MLPVLGATDGADGLILGPTLGPAEMLDGADGGSLTSLFGEGVSGSFGLILVGMGPIHDLSGVAGTAIVSSRAFGGTSGTLGSTAVGADGATDGADGANVYVLGSMFARPGSTDTA